MEELQVVVMAEDMLESDRLSNLIIKTPRAGKEEVREYHRKIKQELDSGKIIKVPSGIHRILHEIMWIKGHEIYNMFDNFNQAAAHFCKDTSDTSAECLNFRNEEARFRVWYAETYLNVHSYEVHPEMREWATATMKEAKTAALKYFKKPLGKIIDAE